MSNWFKNTSVATINEIEKMTHTELKDYLEQQRGFAVYDEETTRELREAAISDSNEENGIV